MGKVSLRYYLKGHLKDEKKAFMHTSGGEVLWVEGTVCVASLMWDNFRCTEGLKEAPESRTILRKGVDDIAKGRRV